MAICGYAAMNSGGANNNRLDQQVDLLSSSHHHAKKETKMDEYEAKGKSGKGQCGKGKCGKGQKEEESLNDLFDEDREYYYFCLLELKLYCLVPSSLNYKNRPLRSPQLRRPIHLLQLPPRRSWSLRQTRLVLLRQPRPGHGVLRRGIQGLSPIGIPNGQQGVSDDPLRGIQDIHRGREGRKEARGWDEFYH